MHNALEKISTHMRTFLTYYAWCEKNSALQLIESALSCYKVNSLLLQKNNALKAGNGFLVT